MKEQERIPGPTVSKPNIPEIKARCEAAGPTVPPPEPYYWWEWYSIDIPMLVAALEEAQKIVDILKPTMNLGVVQVPPPIIDHERLYALKDAINAYDAILGESK